MPNRINAKYRVNISEEGIKALSNTKSMRRGLEILGQVAETSAKQHAPVDTGNLRRSITHEVNRDIRGLYVRYGTNVLYGFYQEFGTRYHRPQPFLRPALESVRRTLGS